MDSETVISTRECDIRALNLSAAEAFVLSRIDGKTSLEDLAESVGMDLEQASVIVSRLAELNAVVTEQPTSRYCATFRSRAVRVRKKNEPSRSPRPRSEPESARREQPAVAPRSLRAPEPPSAPPGGISASLTRKIVELDARLDSLSDLELLGIGETAGEHEIKRAFARLANAFDPSNYLGVDLGKLLAPMERIFARAAAAQERVLSRARSIRPRDKAEARKATSKPARRKSQAVAAASSRPPQPGSSKPARKSRRMQAVDSAMNAAAYARASEEAYRREMAGRQRQSDESKARTFVEAAQQVEAQGDIVVAAQHYRLALQVDDNEDVRKALGRIDDAAQRIVYEAARRQGADAERAERWALAAARYGAAYDVIAEPQLAERIAYALMRDGKDLRRALKMAEQAVMNEPKHARFRITLAEVCLAAGLKTRAAGEADRARAIAPQDERVLDFLARLESESRGSRR